MELVLAFKKAPVVSVTCDGQSSHTFDLHTLVPDETDPQRPPQPLLDPVKYGQALFQALFPPESLAAKTVDKEPDRILLIIEDDAIQAIPWEYIHNGEDFLVLEVPFVRGLPADDQSSTPDLGDTPLHIVAIPSNPIAEKIAPLNIAGEWQRLREIVDEIPRQVTLERTTPPTLDSLRKRVSQKEHRVVHFMGHGGEHKDKTVLFFENEQGGMEPLSLSDR